MSIWSRLRAITSRSTSRSTTSNPNRWMIDWIRDSGGSSSGIAVNEESAMRYTPFWAAVRVISGSVSSLPLLTYQRTASGKDRAMHHPIYKLLRYQPNEFVDAMTLIETRQAHALVYGNGYAEIQRDGAGRPVALWPLLPTRTERKISAGGVPYYEITLPNAKTVNLPDRNVLHLKGLGFDGYTGHNVVAYHKEAIGLGMATKKYGAKFFTNAATPSGVLQHPGHLGEAGQKTLRKSWQKDHGGLDNANRVAILEEGMTWSPMGVSPEDAQCLETQKFSVDDIARIFNIPPHKIGSLERATFSNIEQQSIDFVTQTLYYWLRKWECEINTKLFTPLEQSTYFAEFLLDAFLRGDTLSRYQSYVHGRNWGWLSVNDIRRLENMNTIGDKGDIYLEPLNMKPAGEELVPPEPPEPPADDDADTDDEEAKSVYRHAARMSLLSTAAARMIRREINAIVRASAAGSFSDWLVRYYGGEYEAELLAALEPLAQRDDAVLITQAVTGHCRESLRLLSSVVATCGPNDIATAIPRYVRNWDCSRPAELVNAIIEGNDNA